MKKTLTFMRATSNNSIEAQMAVIQSYIDAHEMMIEKSYTDITKTGENIYRPEYCQMINDIKEGKVDSKCIIVASSDRLHRNIVDMIADIEWFTDNGIKFISVADGINTDNN